MIAVGVVALLAPAAASAQWRLTPHVGAYLPAAELGKASKGGGHPTFEQEPGFVVGLNAMRWFPGRFGFEGSVGYVMSNMKYSEGTRSVTADAYLVQTAARLLYRFTGPDFPAEMYVGAGPAVFFSGGDASSRGFFGSMKVDRGTEFGGTVGTGARVRVNDMLAWRLGVDGYFYSATAKVSFDNPVELPSRFQSDFVLSAGLSLALPTR
jgi:hypothetical protein